MARIARGEEVVDSAMQVIATAVTVEQLRQAQAVVLPLRFAMSLEQTAAVTGLSVGWVSKQRNRFIQGKAVGDGTVPARGGRRRQNFTPQEEAAVLKPFLERARAGAILVVGQIKHDLEEALGRPMSLSSVYTLLHRHNWRKLAPDRLHPQSDHEAQEEWKKTPPIAPSNIRLLALPPYAPELNPVEHLWDELREKCFHNKVFASIDALEDDLVMGLLAMENTPEVVRSITNWPSIIDVLSKWT